MDWAPSSEAEYRDYTSEKQIEVTAYYIPDASDHDFGFNDALDLIPIHQTTFYDTICRRCCLPDHKNYNPSTRFNINCMCHEDHKKLKTSAEEPRPGSAIVRFTMIEVFQQKERYGDCSSSSGFGLLFRLPLAVEMEAKFFPVLSWAPKLLVPKDPGRSEKNMEILRGPTVLR